MHDRPTASELLQVAREALLAELLPNLSGEQKYSALMIASAMGIAVREAELGHAALAEELDMFARLYGGRDVTRAGGGGAQRLMALRARLANEIRCGKFDNEPGARLRRMLLERVCTQLRISNPKYLETTGLVSGRDS
ncbi:MAG: hypothetical protein BMS9Abin10_1061 [Gammaproteobacteria bacterium]|nr:MAG: hypothetical protein BMS9Abin10_1061 [Gammaproteobacteria bacterium]